MLRCGSALFLIVFILIAFLTLSVRNPAVPLAGVKAQSSCTPPTYLGYPSTCGIIGILWLRVDTVSQIDHYDILRYGIKIGEAPANAQSYSDRVGCDFAAIYTIKQVMKSGATCSTVTTGSPPHTRPCDICLTAPLLNVVTSASFTSPVMPGSIVTVFAKPTQPMTSVTAAAGSLPLPFNLGGTQVSIDGVPAGLFYVSPNQINFLMPDIRPGAVEVLITGSNGERTEGNALTGINPCIFTADSSGTGVAAALVTTDGQNFQHIFDENRNAIPISVGNSEQQKYLILYGTGIRNQGEVQVKIAGRSCNVVFAGAHPGLPGLDQINVQLPQSLQGVGLTYITVLAGGLAANFAQINIGN